MFIKWSSLVNRKNRTLRGRQTECPKYERFRSDFRHSKSERFGNRTKPVLSEIHMFVFQASTLNDRNSGIQNCLKPGFPSVQI